MTRTLAQVARDQAMRPTAIAARAAINAVESVLRVTVPRLPYRVRQRVTPHVPVRRAVGVHPASSARTSGRRVILVSNDLSESGAPRLFAEMAGILAARGDEVVVFSPEDGAMRQMLIELGASVIVDALVLEGSSRLLSTLAPMADCAFCNTVVTERAVATLSRHCAVGWYIHETALLDATLTHDARVRDTLNAVKVIWAGSELPAAMLRPYRPDVEVVPYGLDPLGPVAPPDPAADRPLRIGIFGSYEPRKGQDLAAAAMALLTPDERRQVRLVMHGRVFFEDFQTALLARAATMPEIEVGPALSQAAAGQAIIGCDAVLMPSRDDTLPMVTADALGVGKVLICTRTVGTAAYLTPGIDGFVAEEPTAEAIAAALSQAIARRADWADIGRAGRRVFDRVFARDVFVAKVEAAFDQLCLASAKA